MQMQMLAACQHGASGNEHWIERRAVTAELQLFKKIRRTLAASIRLRDNGKIHKIERQAVTRADSCLCPDVDGGHGNPRLLGRRSELCRRPAGHSDARGGR